MRSVLFAFSMVLGVVSPAAAQEAAQNAAPKEAAPRPPKEQIPTNGAALEKRLQQYDPKAVAAARHYYMQPAVKAGLVAMTDNMNTAMSNLVAQQNPNLSPQQLEKMRRVIGEATRDRLDLILEMSMVVALDTLSTNQLVALDKFYSSPLGESILAKMPKIAQALPAMMRTIMPDYMADVKERLKQNGAELRL